MSKSKSNPGREPFTTIDDLIKIAQELFEGLNKLGEYKHPLDIRRGVSILAANENNSKTIKAGSKTFFFDLKKTKEGKAYLAITESRFKGEGQERERITMIVFPEFAQEFKEAISEMIAQLG